MQEGTLALMQLAKTCAVLARMADRGVPFLSLLTDPTTGGVFASFSALGDVNIAEPNALIGFAGARVAAGTTGETLPEGFQRSEFLFRHGFVDLVVPRAELQITFVGLLRYLQSAPVRAAARSKGAAASNGRARTAVPAVAAVEAAPAAAMETPGV
jgi:acetyl-CoA carboxylase carboxyl transferase subunit beta